MKWKTLSWISIAVGLALVCVGFILPLIELQNLTAENGPIAIIGGADLPTYQFLFSRWPVGLAVIGVCLIVAAVLCLIFKKTDKKSSV